MSSESLLPYDGDEEKDIYTPLKARNGSSAIVRVLIGAVVVLVATNIYTFAQYQDLHKQLRRVQQPQPQPQSPDALGVSEFAGLSYNTPTVYSNYTDYWGTNQTLSDQLWDQIDTDPLEVALTDEYAQAHNIEPSVFRFPWDENKGVYYLKVFHSLHCLKSMRKVFVDYERGNTNTIHSGHIHHCLDALRQDLLCQADDTPMPMTDLPNKVGHNQVRMCRNYDELVAWTRHPDRHACYHRWTDYGQEVVNKIESYDFCPEDSPYYKLSKAYFAKWGHLDPFGPAPTDGLPS